MINFNIFYKDKELKIVANNSLGEEDVILFYLDLASKLMFSRNKLMVHFSEKLIESVKGDIKKYYNFDKGHYGNLTNY